ncbi:hypothetical protein D0868_10329 [Hortaea werneckii]|uniref:GH18 domain-containing protein n=1 Tax=Hortaea werneckii TaxID=91943 RepID=A0A3M6Y4R5_HORWE|nr:hypothetical protein D0868_10329 [Hortaea werneckii]
MTLTSSSCSAFIRSLKLFLRQYAFDGVDIDWEYPVAEDRGGKVADYKNFVVFLEELRSGLGTKYGITATLPISYWYLQHFDVESLLENLDWLNMMSELATLTISLSKAY